MIIRKFLQLISLGLLLYLLVDNFMNFDLAATKNNYIISMRKIEIDSTQNIDTVKQKAKEYLDTIRRVHRQCSAQSIANFWILGGLFFIQTVLLSMKLTANSTKQNGW